MEYIVSNITTRGEIRISNKEMEGKLIYKGHRLGIPDDLLPHIIHYTHEKFRNSNYFLDYKKWKDIYNFEKLTPQMNKCWFKETDNKKALLHSYKLLLETLKEEVGDFKNIYVVEVI